MKVVTPLWAVVNGDGWLMHWTVAYSRKEAQKIAATDSVPAGTVETMTDWRERWKSICRRRGDRAVKINITLTS